MEAPHLRGNSSLAIRDKIGWCVILTRACGILFLRIASYNVTPRDEGVVEAGCCLTLYYSPQVLRYQMHIPLSGRQVCVAEAARVA